MLVHCTVPWWTVVRSSVQYRKCAESGGGCDIRNSPPRLPSLLCTIASQGEKSMLFPPVNTGKGKIKKTKRREKERERKEIRGNVMMQ